MFCQRECMCHMIIHYIIIHKHNVYMSTKYCKDRVLYQNTFIISLNLEKIANNLSEEIQFEFCTILCTTNINLDNINFFQMFPNWWMLFEEWSCQEYESTQY